MQNGWNLDAQRAGSLQVDDQLERSRLHDWQLRRLRTSKNAARVNACLAIGARDIRAVADEAPRSGIVTKWVDRRDRKTRRSSDDVIRLVQEEWICTDKGGVWRWSRHRGEGGLCLFWYVFV